LRGLREVESEARRATATRWSILILFAFWAWLWNIVVGFTQRTASSPACKPGINAYCVEGVATGETSHVIIILESIKADGTSISWRSKKFWRCSIANRIVFIVLVVVDDILCGRSLLDLRYNRRCWFFHLL
jgi:hypothetical protein